MNVQGEKPKKVLGSAAPMAMAGAVMLKQRNAQMSALQHIIGLVSDFGGAIDKSLSIMASCGLSVVPSNINTKKQHIESYHKDTTIHDILMRKQIIESTYQAEPVCIYSANGNSIDLIKWLLEGNPSPLSMTVLSPVTHHVGIYWVTIWTMPCTHFIEQKSRKDKTYTGSFCSTHKDVLNCQPEQVRQNRRET